MPIYEYQCRDCGHDFETIQKMSEPPLVDCPVCEKPKLKKLVSAVAFRLKGSGWYETDFKTDRKRNVADGVESDAQASKESEKGDKAESSDGSSKSADSSVSKDSDKSTSTAASAADA